MSKSGRQILRGARQALAYARGARQGFVAHSRKKIDGKNKNGKPPTRLRGSA